MTHRCRRRHGNTLGTHEVSHRKLTPAAASFISNAISERRHVHPEESQAQSKAIAYSKARDAGYKVPKK